MEKVVSGFVDCKLCYLHIYIDIYPTWVYYIRKMEKGIQNHREDGNRTVT